MSFIQGCRWPRFVRAADAQRYPAIDRGCKIMDKRTCEKCGKIYVLEKFAGHSCSPKRRKKRPKRLRVAQARKKRDDAYVGDEYIRPGLPSRKHRSVTRTREERDESYIRPDVPCRKCGTPTPLPYGRKYVICQDCRMSVQGGLPSLGKRRP